MNKDSKSIFEAYSGERVRPSGIANSDLVHSDIDEMIYTPKEFIAHLDVQREIDIQDIGLERDPSSPHGYLPMGHANAAINLNWMHFDRNGKLVVDMKKGQHCKFTRIEDTTDDIGDDMWRVDSSADPRTDEIRLGLTIKISESDVLRYFEFSSSGRARSALGRL